MKKSLLINLNDENINVEIIRKNIRNMYLRVKNDMKIYITCNYLCSDNYILKFVKANEKSILNMLERQKRINDKSNYFILLGKKYEIVECESFKKITFDDNKVYVKNKLSLNRYTRKEAIVLFENRLKFNYDMMKLNEKYPTLVIKNMKAKWGYYNKNKNIICLNLNLMSYSIDDIDYVIIHELSHIKHFNHSKEFWEMVAHYKKDYKNNKKHLKE